MSSFNETIGIDSMQFGNDSTSSQTAVKLDGSGSKKAHKNIQLTNLSTSTGNLGYGNSSITATNCAKLEPGESVLLEIETPSDIFALSVTGVNVDYTWISH